MLQRKKEISLRFSEIRAVENQMKIAPSVVLFLISSSISISLGVLLNIPYGATFIVAGILFLVDIAASLQAGCFKLAKRFSALPGILRDLAEYGKSLPICVTEIASADQTHPSFEMRIDHQISSNLDRRLETRGPNSTVDSSPDVIIIESASAATSYSK